MGFWLLHIRRIVLLISILLATGLYAFVFLTIPEGSLRIIRLTQLYAFTSIMYLYISLLATPLLVVFPTFALRGLYIKARRALGVSAWFFGLLHARFAFFDQLGGFPGLSYLDNTYLVSVALGAVGLCIFSCMAMTSFDYMVAKLSFPRWKLLHRFVYVAGICVVLHALLLGTHFVDLSALIPQLFFTALALLFVLEAIRIDKYLRTRWVSLPSVGPFTTVAVAFSLVFVFSSFLPQNAQTNTIGIHSQHIQIAKENQQQTASQFTALRGDKTKRYTVSLDPLPPITPDTDVTVQFRVYDASTGEPVKGFSKISDKFVHLIVVDNSLIYFSHIHPTQTENRFTITMRFPKADVYHLYLDFQPFGAIEQQFAFVVPVGNSDNKIPATQPIDTTDKTIGPYKIRLATTAFTASAMSVGNQTMSFDVTNAATGKPVTTLKPYLGAFGHLVLINQKTYEYIHVHPTVPATSPTSVGGPSVTFLPLGLYGAIKPGIYRVFAQLNPDDTLITADYTIEVK